MDAVPATLVPVLQMVAIFLLIVSGLILYATEKLPMEITALLMVCGVLVLFVIVPEFLPSALALSSAKILSGFGSPALLTVVGLLIIGEGLAQTGVLFFVTRQFSSSTKKARGTVVSFMLIACALSAFLNNIPIVVLFIPVLLAFFERTRQNSPWALMGMSFASVLGGMTTLIGSSTNLLVASALVGMNRDSLGFFSFTIPGICIALVGLLYIVFVMPRLLSKRRSGWMTRTLARTREGKRLVVQFTITGDSPFVGKSPSARLFSVLRAATVVLVQRGELSFTPPKTSFVLRAGDVLLISANRKRIDDMIASEEHGLLVPQLSGGARGQEPREVQETILAEFFIPPNSTFVGRTLQDLRFRFRSSCVVLGLERGARRMLRGLTSSPLRAGDIALIQGRRSDLLRLENQRDLIAIEDSMRTLPDRERAAKAIAIFTLMVLASSSGVVPISLAAIGGATAMLALRVLSVNDAVRSIDQRIVLLIASAIALGIALQATGGDTVLANTFLFLTQNFSPPFVLSCFFLFVALLSNVISTKAAAVLFTPVAVAIADSLQVSHIPFAIAVLFAANCAFATPVAYQTSMLVMSAGQYRFNDFIKAGLPLVFVCWIAFTLLCYGYFSL